MRRSQNLRCPFLVPSRWLCRMKGFSVLLQFKSIISSERFKVKRQGTCFDSKNISDLYIFTLCKQFLAWSRICINQKNIPWNEYIPTSFSRLYFFKSYSCNNTTMTKFKFPIKIEMAFSQILAIRWWIN